MLKLLTGGKVVSILAVLLISSLAVSWGAMRTVKNVKAERDQLRANVTQLEGALEQEREAAVIAATDRAEALRRLDEFRKGREQDPEAQTWAAQPIPAGERQRLCEALGCIEI